MYCYKPLFVLTLVNNSGDAARPFASRYQLGTGQGDCSKRTLRAVPCSSLLMGKNPSKRVLAWKDLAISLSLTLLSSSLLSRDKAELFPEEHLHCRQELVSVVSGYSPPHRWEADTSLLWRTLVIEQRAMSKAGLSQEAPWPVQISSNKAHVTPALWCP